MTRREVTRIQGRPRNARPPNECGGSSHLRATREGLGNRRHLIPRWHSTSIVYRFLAVVGDLALNTRVVHLGQFLQCLVAAMMKRPPSGSSGEDAPQRVGRLWWIAVAAAPYRKASIWSQCFC